MSTVKLAGPNNEFNIQLLKYLYVPHSPFHAHITVIHQLFNACPSQHQK